MRVYVQVLYGMETSTNELALAESSITGAISLSTCPSVRCSFDCNTGAVQVFSMTHQQAAVHMTGQLIVPPSSSSSPLQQYSRCGTVQQGGTMLSQLILGGTTGGVTAVVDMKCRVDGSYWLHPAIADCAIHCGAALHGGVAADVAVAFGCYHPSTALTGAFANACGRYHANWKITYTELKMSGEDRCSFSIALCSCRTGANGGSQHLHCSCQHMRAHALHAALPPARLGAAHGHRLTLQPDAMPAPTAHTNRYLKVIFAIQTGKCISCR